MKAVSGLDVHKDTIFACILQKGKDPFINEYHAYAFNHATPDEIKTIGRISSKVNDILKYIFHRR